MATGRDKQSWSGRGLIRRDFRQDHGAGPEEIKGHPKRKSGEWCKKEGREHRWEKVVAYQWYDKCREETIYRYEWRCAGCGKKSWGEPRKPMPPHKHEYTLTEIDESDLIFGWAKMYEVCSKCGKRGKSIYIDE